MVVQNAIVVIVLVVLNAVAIVVLIVVKDTIAIIIVIMVVQNAIIVVIVVDSIREAVAIGVDVISSAWRHIIHAIPIGSSERGNGKKSHEEEDTSHLRVQRDSLVEVNQAIKA